MRVSQILSLPNSRGLVNFFIASVLLMIFSNETFGQKINFSEHIAPIIFENCTSCHRPNQIAPIPFTNFEEVSSYASMIKYVTEIKYMPPWKAVNTNHSYQGERGLTQKEIDLIKQWVEDGVEEGDPEKLPTLPKFDDEPQMKNPDAVYSMSEAFEQYGVYYDQFKVFVLPTNLEEEKAVSAIEFIPGNASIVRSCFISIDTSDKVKSLDQWDPTYGYFSFGEVGFVPNESRWYTWNPLKPMAEFPKGISKHLPKNAKLLLHIHYGPTGVPLKDSSEVRIQFASDLPARNIQMLPLIHPYNLTNTPFQVSENEVIRYHAKFTVPYDLELRAIMPHSHLLGNKWEIFAVEPEGRGSQILLKIEDWDYKWKRQYDHSKPVILKKGTVVHALAQYDNTLKNPSNPSDPPRSMKWGKRMFQEMFLVYFEVLPLTKTSDIEPLFNPSLITEGRLDFHFFNKKNQKLSATIQDFKGDFTSEIFSNKTFTIGKQMIRFSQKDLPKGNYFLEMSNENGNKILSYLFINVESTFLN